LLKKFDVMNRSSQSSNFTKLESEDQSYSAVEYPHLTSLDIMYEHFNYVENFLRYTKIHLPNLTELRVRYNKLKIVTQFYKIYNTIQLF
jgi:hypothetical protein